MARHLYFAYGSNLHPLRLRRRAPGASVLGVALLRGHRLCFHKRGKDGSAKCDARHSGRRGDVVRGVVYRIPRRDQRALDRAEDLGRGYDRVRVSVSLRGRRLTAYTYKACADAVADGLQPFGWYLDYVLCGARHHGLPRRYIADVEQVEGRCDADGARRRANRILTLRKRFSLYRRR